VGTFSTCGLWLKTFDSLVLPTAARCVVTLLGASVWGCGILRSCFGVTWQVSILFEFYFILSLICYVRGSSPRFVLMIRPHVTYLQVKRKKILYFKKRLLKYIGMHVKLVFGESK
jgi:hypothetical protein